MPSSGLPARFDLSIEAMNESSHSVAQSQCLSRGFPAADGPHLKNLVTDDDSEKLLSLGLLGFALEYGQFVQIAHLSGAWAHYPSVVIGSTARAPASTNGIRHYPTMHGFRAQCQASHRFVLRGKEASGSRSGR